MGEVQDGYLSQMADTNGWVLFGSDCDNSPLPRSLPVFIDFIRLNKVFVCRGCVQGPACRSMTSRRPFGSV